eukprot:SAG11_NODE_994_length_6261_cov_10.558747_5_plen_108_part_00
MHCVLPLYHYDQRENSVLTLPVGEYSAGTAVLHLAAKVKTAFGILTDAGNFDDEEGIMREQQLIDSDMVGIDPVHFVAATTATFAATASVDCMLTPLALLPTRSSSG